jgi:hypothetical protein
MKKIYLLLIIVVILIIVIGALYFNYTNKDLVYEKSSGLPLYPGSFKDKTSSFLCSADSYAVNKLATKQLLSNYCNLLVSSGWNLIKITEIGLFNKQNVLANTKCKFNPSEDLANIEEVFTKSDQSIAVNFQLIYATPASLGLANNIEPLACYKIKSY